jgi:hypothetical protein
MKEEAIASIERLEHTFGSGPQQLKPGSTEAEREQRRQAQKRVLLAGEDKKS